MEHDFKKKILLGGYLAQLSSIPNTKRARGCWGGWFSNWLPITQVTNTAVSSLEKKKGRHFYLDARLVIRTVVLLRKKKVKIGNAVCLIAIRRMLCCAQLFLLIRMAIRIAVYTKTHKKTHRGNEENESKCDVLLFFFFLVSLRLNK